MQVNQKQGVTNAVLSLFPDYVLGGEITLASLLSSENKKQLRAILFEGFRADEITMSDEAKAKYLGNDTGLNKYVSGLLDNWVRKNKEFNNGLAYIPDPEKVGTRAGSGDDQVRAMRNLKKTTNDPAIIAEIDAAIKDRLAIIKPTQSVEIDVNALPEHLRHLVETTED